MAPETASEETDSGGFDLARMPAERLLVVVAGVCAIGFGGLALVLRLMNQDEPPFSNFATVGGAVFGFAIALVFGLALLLAAARMTQKGAEGGILALAFSIVLLAFGSMPGLIAGIVGLIGALTGLVRNLKFNS